MTHCIPGFFLIKRSMKRTAIIISAILLITLSGCKEIKVTYDDNGKTIDMVMGQVLKIELPSNASSGNTWRKIAYNDSVIVKSGKPNYVLGDDGIGSAGMYFFRFKPIAAGTSKLVMEYGNKYDYGKKPLKVFELTVVVHDVEE